MRLATIIAGCCALLAQNALTATPSHSVPAPSLEYQVKAGFLYNFAKFVQWPAGVFAADDSPIILGILGTDPFGPFLDEAVKAEPIGRRLVIVKRVNRAEDAGQCHVLFVPASESSLFGAIVGSMRESHVLTVGESDDFLNQGGVFNFVIEQNKVRFEVSLPAARASQVEISSKVLRLARNVRN